MTAPVAAASYEIFIPTMVKLADGNVGAGSVLAEICYCLLQKDSSGKVLSDFFKTCTAKKLSGPNLFQKFVTSTGKSSDIKYQDYLVFSAAVSLIPAEKNEKEANAKQLESAASATAKK